MQPGSTSAAEEGCDSAAGPLLSTPRVEHQDSFLKALLGYHADGLHLDLNPDDLSQPSNFAAWIDRLRRDGLDGAADEARDRVPHRILWWVDGATYLGVVRIALELSHELRDYGGHIGYDVRPGARGRGHATALLAAALEVARSLGLDEVLLTCAPENTASRRVIERNGGRLLTSAREGACGSGA